jgi:IMP dehydrogenase
MELTEALTFDDVLLKPVRSDVAPAEAKLGTRLTRNLNLNIPLSSAAMDTVTESRAAITMARLGGIGIIHRNLTIEAQIHEVDSVKRSESGMIPEPVTVNPDTPLKEVLSRMDRYQISGVPVTEADGKLVGILTNRDLRFADNLEMKASELMTRDLVTVQEGISLEEAKKKLHVNRIEKLLVVNDDFYLRGLITFKDMMKSITYPNANKDEKGRLRVGAAVGVSGDFMERALALESAGVDVITVDTAHGYTGRVMDAVRNLKKNLKRADVIAGNIACGEAAKELFDAGADAVKVGMGPGSICTTRVVTGAGVPQFTAITDTVEVASALGIPVIADGGIKYSGDIVKALAAGADSVMIGNLFAGTDESPGELIFYQNRSYKTYRGMGSLGAMAVGYGTDRYGHEQKPGLKKVAPEGIEGRVPYKGGLEDFVTVLLGGLQAGMGYCGAANIEQLQEKAVFIKVSEKGVRESHVHDVMVTKEAPNYRIES